jgi:hypothetical protein
VHAVQHAGRTGDAAALAAFVTPELAGQLRRQPSDRSPARQPSPGQQRYTVQIVTGGGRHDRRCITRVVPPAGARRAGPAERAAADATYWRFVRHPVHGWVVAAVDVPLAAIDLPPPAHTEPVVQTWVWLSGPDGLHDNRRGVLTRQQRIALRLFGAGMALLSTGLGTGWLVFGALRTGDPGERVLALVAAVTMILLGPAVLYYQWAAARSGAVECIVGRVRVRQIGVLTQLIVRRRRFRIGLNCPVVSGARYRVYVCAKAVRVVALEPAGRASRNLDSPAGAI